MTTTTNYGYNVVEGTDQVNIQTQIAPNFTAIDTDLKTVSDAAITTATHTVAGTVHQLVRDDSDRAVIRFVATGDFATGDTFTVDGLTVTARLVNGEALQTGSFKINNCVEAVLVGTVLNVNAINPTVSDASDVSYDNTGSGLAASDVQDAIDEVVTGLGSVASDLNDLDGKVTGILTATLSAGSTSVTISDASITASSIIDYWQQVGNTATDLIAPLTIAVAPGSVTMTFEAQANSVVVGIRVLS